MTAPVPNHSAFVTFSAAESVASSAPSLGGNNRKRCVSGNMVKAVDLESRHMQQDVSGQPCCDAGHLPQKRRCRQSRSTALSGAFTSTEQTLTAPLGGPGAIMLQSPSRPVAVANPQLMKVDPVKDPFPSLLAESRSERRQSLTVDLAPDSSEILSKFTVTHQNQIKKYLHHPGVKTVLSNTRMLLKTLEDRHIQLSMNRAKPPIPTLFSKLELFDIVKDHPMCSQYFHKARVFFSATGQTINNTGCLTSMLKSKESVIHFTNMDDGDVTSIAGNFFLKQVSSMCNNKGIPEEANVKAFLNLPCLKEGWQGDDEAVKDQPLDRALVTRISSMCNGKGLPKEAEVKAFLQIPCLKEGWQDNDEAVKDKSIDRTLITHISSMCNGKGLPKEAEVKAFLQLSCLKEGWHGNDEAVKDKPIDRTLITHISSMCNGKGLPKEAEVKAFLQIPCLKEGWQGDDEAVKNHPLDRALVINISSMCSGKGLPKGADVKACLKLPCLKEGWQGNDEAVKDRPLDKSLVPHISSICHGRGLPKAADVEAFLKRPCLKEGWQGDDEVVKDQPLNRALVTHISSMCSGKGLPLPKEADVKAFLKLSCLKEGWQGNDEAVKDQPIDWALVTHISSMCCKKGLPKEADVKAFLKQPCLKEGWQGNDEAVRDEPFDRALAANISSMCASKGLPKVADVKTFLQIPCLKEGWQGDDEAVKNQPIDRALVANISSMFNCKGLPKGADVKAFLKQPCLKEGWQGNDEVVKDQPLDRALVTNISSMCSGKGLPKKADVKAFLKLPCLKEGWQGNDEVVKNQPLDRALVTCISSMCCKKGLPKEAEVKAFVFWLLSDERTGLLKLACRVYSCSGLPKPALLTEHVERLRHCLKGDEYSTDSEDEGSDMGDDLPEAGQMRALALFCAAPEKRRMKLTEFKRYLAAHNSARNERTVVHAVLASLLSMLANHGGPGVRLWLEMHDQNPCCKKVLTQALSIPAPLGRTKYALTQLPESQWQEYLELCKHLKPAPNPAQWMALQPLCELLNRRFPFTFAKRMMLEILWPQSEDNRLKYVNKMDCLFKTVPTVSQLYWLHRALGPKKMQDFLDACLVWQNAKGIVPEVTVQERLLEGLLVTHHYLPEYEAIPDLCFSKRVSSENERGVIIDGDYAMRGKERLWHFIAALLMELQQTEYQFKKLRLRVYPPDGEPVVLPKPEFTPTDTGFVINNWSLEQLTAFFKATEFHEQWSKKPDNHGALGTIRGEEKLAPIDTTTPAVTTIPQPMPSASPPAPWHPEPDSTTQGAATTFEAAMNELDRFQVLGKTELEMLAPHRGWMTMTQLMSVMEKIHHHSVDVETQIQWSIAFENRRKELLGLNEIGTPDFDLWMSDPEPQNPDWLEQLLPKLA